MVDGSAAAATTDEVTTVLQGIGGTGVMVSALTFAPDGAMYAAFGRLVWRVGPDGSQRHFAGVYTNEGEPAPSGDGRPATELPLPEPVGALAVTSDGSVWMGGSGRLWRVDDGGIAHALAGDGRDLDPATGTPTYVGFASGMAPLPNGDVVVTTGTGHVFTIDAAGTITPLADLGNYVSGVTVSPSGEIFVAAFDQVLRIRNDGTDLVAGSGSGQDNQHDGEVATNASIYPAGIAAEPDGNLLISAAGRIRRIHMDATPPTIGTVTGVHNMEWRDGDVATARYANPQDLAVRGADLYIGDGVAVGTSQDGGRIRRVPRVIGQPDLPTQPADPPIVELSTQPADTDMPDGWQPALPAPSQPPVRVDMTVTSPNGIPIRRLAIGDVSVSQDPIVDTAGNSASIELRRPGLHLLAFYARDDFGIATGWQTRVYIAVPDEACPSDVPDSGFTDVPATNVHRAAIDCAFWRGIALGVDAQHFAPDRILTRGQMASFIVQCLEMAGLHVPDGPDAFTDDNSDVHEQNINRLAGVGIVQGRAPGTYDPTSTVSRDQMASFLMRAYEWATESTLPPASPRFVDVPAENVHAGRINQAAELGVVLGVTSDHYAPQLPVRRDQTASFITRVLDRTLASVNASTDG